MSCWICMRMKPARVLSVLRFLGTTKEIDGLRKKPPCTHSTTSRFLTSSGLDHFVKETRERVIRLDSCNPSLGDRFKAVCCDYRSTFFFPCCSHTEDRTTLKIVLTSQWWGRKRRVAHLNQATYPPIMQQMFFCLHGKCYSFGHRTHPRWLQKAALCFLPQPERRLPPRRVHVRLITFLLTIIFLLFGMEGGSNHVVIKICLFRLQICF